MRRGLTDCAAVVTGAGSGIGRAVALMLAAEGARVALVGRDRARLLATAEAAAREPSRALVMPADLEEEGSIRLLAEAIRDQLGDLHVLVHGAGAIAVGAFQALGAASFDRQYRVNVRAPFLLTQAVLPLIVRSRGQIVFVNSSAGLVARAGVSQYAASKHALRALADSLREEVHADGVRVMSIFPGRTATPMQQAVRDMEQKPDTPASYLQPDDVAAAIVSALTLPDTAEVKEISIRPMQEESRA